MKSLKHLSALTGKGGKEKKCVLRQYYTLMEGVISTEQPKMFAAHPSCPSAFVVRSLLPCCKLHFPPPRSPQAMLQHFLRVCKVAQEPQGGFHNLAHSNIQTNLLGIKHGNLQEPTSLASVCNVHSSNFRFMRKKLWEFCTMMVAMRSPCSSKGRLIAPTTAASGYWRL